MVYEWELISDAWHIGRRHVFQDGGSQKVKEIYDVYVDVVSYFHRGVGLVYIWYGSEILTHVGVMKMSHMRSDRH